MGRCVRCHCEERCGGRASGDCSLTGEWVAGVPAWNPEHWRGRHFVPVGPVGHHEVHEEASCGPSCACEVATTTVASLSTSYFNFAGRWGKDIWDPSVVDSTEPLALRWVESQTKLRALDLEESVHDAPSAHLPPQPTLAVLPSLLRSTGRLWQRPRETPPLATLHFWDAPPAHRPPPPTTAARGWI